MDSRDLIIYYTVKYSGEFKSVLDAIMKRELANGKIVQDVAKRETDSSEVLTGMDMYGYPDYLKEKPEPPVVLFYKGKINLLNNNKNNKVIIMSDELECGKEAINLLTRELADNEDNAVVVIDEQGVSGDQRTLITHLLLSGVKVIAILETGITAPHSEGTKNIIENIVDNGGLVITQFPSTVVAATEATEDAAQEFACKICTDEILLEVSSRDEKKCMAIRKGINHNLKMRGYTFEKDGVDTTEFINNILQIKNIMEVIKEVKA